MVQCGAGERCACAGVGEMMQCAEVCVRGGGECVRGGGSVCVCGR